MRKNGKLRILLILISTLFVVFMLVLPLFSVIVNAFSKGWDFYVRSLSTKNVLSALKLTLFVTLITAAVNTVFGIAAAWLLTRYSFKGKQVLATLIDLPFSISPVIAGLAFIMMFGRMGWAAPVVDAVNAAAGWNIKIVFAVPGVVLATIFVTFPFVAREIIPVLNAAGKDEEEAAALMGAGGFKIFCRITFPRIKWALCYGILLCSARALGEFGAVNALSKTRGKTFTMPLEIDALYMSGAQDSVVAAYAASSVLVLSALILLCVKNVLEYVSSQKKNREEPHEQAAEGMTNVR